MLEQETDTIIRTVSQRITGTGDGIAVKDILAAEIPHPIKTFFRADVESLLTEELRNFHKSSRFNFQHPEVRGLQSQINSVVVLNYSFPRSEFQERLDNAVHMLVNFLIRPQWTLASVLFEDERKITSVTLGRLLRYFGPYEYLRTLIAHYVQEKNISTLTQAEFSKLVWRMDGEYIRRKAGDELARVMLPMYDFFDFPKNTGAKALPTKALIRYFEDKGLSTVMSRLEGESSKGKQDFALRELGEVLEEVRRTSGAFDAGAFEQPPVPQAQSRPLEVAYRPGGQLTIMPSFGQVPVRSKGVQILAAIDEVDRQRFIRTIFRQDEPSFKSAIESIAKMSSWSDASNFIDENFNRNGVDRHSWEATRFVEVISQQFQVKK
jgi:hypothetical protein